YRALPTFFVVLASRAADARTLSLHDALPICGISPPSGRSHTGTGPGFTTFGIIMGTLSLLLLQRFGEHVTVLGAVVGVATVSGADRKSTRLNSSHVKISYAVFCLKKKRRDVQ